MRVTTEAIYENGVLRLVKPIELPEGTLVSIVVTPTSETHSSQTPAEILAAIAALPSATTEPSSGFSGRNHDAALYSTGNDP